MFVVDFSVETFVATSKVNDFNVLFSLKITGSVDRILNEFELNFGSPVIKG